MATRWGILSAGKISHDFVTAVQLLDPSEHTVVAVGARNLGSAQDFAKKFNIPKAYGSYEETVKDPQIEVVYIGAINPQHLRLGKLALEHGKHVLCEKPLAMNVKETKELLELAKSKKLFFMEGIWSRFFPAYQTLRAEIEKGTIGDVKQVLVTFGVQIDQVDRVRSKELGGGTILDIGVYCIQFASWVFGGERPVKILAGGHVNSDGVDESTSTTLVFSNGKTATLVTHSKVKMPNEALAIGTKGTLKIKSPFWCPTELETPTGVQTFPVPQTTKRFEYDNSSGLSYQCHEVRRCIQNGIFESPVIPHSETLLISEVMESVRKQLGVVYPQD